MTKLSEYQRATISKIAAGRKTVFIYVPKDDEPDTKDMIGSLLKDHQVVVPKVLPGNRLSACEIRSLEELAPGAFNLLEPIRCRRIRKENIDLLFIPGTAFDEEGNRKGRGKGYFDRFLTTFKGKKPLIGLCMEKKVRKRLVTNEWDVPVDALLTEKRLKIISWPRTDAGKEEAFWNQRTRTKR